MPQALKGREPLIFGVNESEECSTEVLANLHVIINKTKLAFVVDGYGVITFMASDKFGRHNYTGTWRKGLLHGKGVIHWKNGAK